MSQQLDDRIIAILAVISPRLARSEPVARGEHPVRVHSRRRWRLHSNFQCIPTKTNNNNNMACLQGATWFMSTARVFHFLLPATRHVSSLVFSSLHSSPNLPSCCLSSIDCRYFLSLCLSLTLSCLHVVVLPAHAQSVCDIHHHTKFNGSPCVRSSILN